MNWEIFLRRLCKVETSNRVDLAWLVSYKYDKNQHSDVVVFASLVVVVVGQVRVSRVQNHYSLLLYPRLADLRWRSRQRGRLFRAVEISSLTGQLNCAPRLSNRLRQDCIG